MLISFRRPTSMSKSEMRAWVSDRAQTRGPALTLDETDHSDGRAAMLLRVEVQSDSIEAAEEQLEDLMLDMRLLGLRPAVLSAPD